MSYDHQKDFPTKGILGLEKQNITYDDLSFETTYERR